MFIQNINSTAQIQIASMDYSVKSGQDITHTGDPMPVKLAEPAKPTSPPPTEAQLKDVLDSINKSLKQSNVNLQFNVDTTTKRPVIKLVDGETGETIRQFPTEDALAISRSIDRIQQGMLLKQKA
ncbi:MAG: flagellar protein FlaG [Gallionella sp.]|nr:flagellar protein FlaG [Gallionella sp.]MDD4945701.1 flagellar protein FlaG [Gallionella sp.]MDD5611817.1 flagellar protein FlaG [Gallionella sp.]